MRPRRRRAPDRPRQAAAHETGTFSMGLGNAGSHQHHDLSTKATATAKTTMIERARAFGRGL
jgi:hypothetical protein